MAPMSVMSQQVQTAIENIVSPYPQHINIVVKLSSTYLNSTHMLIQQQHLWSGTLDGSFGDLG